MSSQNDATAHEKFLKINRAYEVLKDEDLRKKYDKYGEKACKMSSREDDMKAGTITDMILVILFYVMFCVDVI